MSRRWSPGKRHEWSGQPLGRRLQEYNRVEADHGDDNDEPGSSQIRSALIVSGTFRTRWMYARYLAWRGLQVRDVSTAAAAHDFRQVAEDAAERVETAG
jgi:hypothetical protein